jgi:hypothetical protein
LSEVRRLTPRKGSTAASGHSGSAPTTDQGFKGWSPEGFDCHLRTRRARDDSRYVRYMAEARATLLRYPRTFPRPVGAFCNGIPSEGGIEPSDPIKRDRVRQITCRERTSGPLADPYRTGHGRPLGSPVSNSLETPCSAPSEGNMALSPFLLAERR